MSTRLRQLALLSLLLATFILTVCLIYCGATPEEGLVPAAQIAQNTVTKYQPASGAPASLPKQGCFQPGAYPPPDYWFGVATRAPNRLSNHVNFAPNFGRVLEIELTHNERQFHLQVMSRLPTYKRASGMHPEDTGAVRVDLLYRRITCIRVVELEGAFRAETAPFLPRRK